MDSNQKLTRDQGELFSDPERYRRLVGKLIYLTITRPDLSYPVGVVSQFMQNPHIDHWNAVIRILRYVKGNPGLGMAKWVRPDGPARQPVSKYMGRVQKFSPPTRDSLPARGPGSETQPVLPCRASPAQPV